MLESPNPCNGPGRDPSMAKISFNPPGPPIQEFPAFLYAYLLCFSGGLHPVDCDSIRGLLDHSLNNALVFSTSDFPIFNQLDFSGFRIQDSLLKDIRLPNLPDEAYYERSLKGR